MVRIKLDYATVHKNSNVYLQGKKKIMNAQPYNTIDKTDIFTTCAERKKDRKKDFFLCKL